MQSQSGIGAAAFTLRYFSGSSTLYRLHLHLEGDKYVGKYVFMPIDMLSLRKGNRPEQCCVSYVGVSGQTAKSYYRVRTYMYLQFDWLYP